MTNWYELVHDDQRLARCISEDRRRPALREMPLARKV